MQAVFDYSVRPGVQMSFARRLGRDYMMRSEKRTGAYNSGSSNGRKPPKRRRAGFLYIFISLLLSLLFWPLGTILLWRRKVRWRAGTKLLVSIVTLFLCVMLFGFALTVQTDNPTFTKVQDTVNDFLDDAAEFVGGGYNVIIDRAVEAYDNFVDFSDAYTAYSLPVMADTIDRGVELAYDVREWFSNLVGNEGEQNPDVTTAPDPTDAPADPAATDDPAATVAPEATGTAPAATDEPAVSASPDVTDEPDASSTPEVTVTPETTAAPATTEVSIYVPQTTPDPSSSQPLGSGRIDSTRKLTTAVPGAEASPSITETPTATPTAEPTSIPTPDPALEPKPAGEAVVYYNRSGVGYHMASTCAGMGTARESTLAQAVADGKRRCRNCGTPDAAILEAEEVVWTDEAGALHLTDECAAFEGSWSLMTLTDAIAADYTPCAACRADEYAVTHGHVPTTPTPEPTPTPVPTPTPEPTVVTPSVTLKPAGEALVYHSSNGRWYHMTDNCSGMTGGKLYPLSECAHTHKVCNDCGAPSPELLDVPCLWVDDAEICHTSDECGTFIGSWTLIPRDEALAASMLACSDCGADEYLIPNSTLASN